MSWDVNTVCKLRNRLKAVYNDTYFEKTLFVS